MAFKSQVLPIDPANHGTNILLGGVVYIGNIFTSLASLCTLSNVKNVLLGKARGWMFFPFSRAIVDPVSGDHVSHVICMSSEIKMLGIDAQADIAPVKNHKPVRNGANMKLIAPSMGEFVLGVSAIEVLAAPELTILNPPRFEHTSSPKPTGVGLVDLSEKSFSRWFSHDESILVVEGGV